ncbi:Tetratricopeptide repeat protein [Planctomycetes bacterium CA13]|uniref:Tetratricopeptide repeat protein n=1 Tax=Novipirellula herctigrandis TaxID=2527986 RepID=A0A5C5YN81_9BACT|nr:Tetratricopeptide repeat protein [Planctomycetes bacterium CA13]
MTVVVFVVLECLLALLGVGRVTDTSDPFVGFSSQIPLWERVVDDSGKTMLRTATNKLVWFNEQEFPKEKAAGTRRVFCVGGSTTFGRPYSDNTSFCGWLREFLPVADPSTNWEIINAGGVSYASYRVAAVMQELALYEPDLFVVYSGHNEFLERRTYEGMFEQSEFQMKVTSILSRTRVYGLIDRAIHSHLDAKEKTQETLSGDVDEILNHTVGPADYHRDDIWRSKVLDHYRFNLQRMISIARGAGAEIVFVVPASNEKNCSPFKSELPSNISELDRQQFAEWYDQASRAEADGDVQQAIERLKQTKQIDDRYPLVDYRLGRLQFDTQAIAESKKSFQRALNEDVCALRAPDDFVAAVRSIGDQRKAMTVDFDRKLRERCQRDYGHSILGAEYFLDHVHPTIEAHRALALWIVECLQDHHSIGGDPIEEVDVATVKRLVESRINLASHGIAQRNLAKVLHWAGKFEEAEPRARDAIETLGGDHESQLVRADCLYRTNRIDEAAAEYESLLVTYPFDARAYHRYGEMLIDLEEYKKARDYLSVAVAGLPDGSRSQARSVFSLGMAHLKLSEFRQAEMFLEQLQQDYPHDRDTLILLAEAKAGRGDSVGAIALYEQVIRQSPDDVYAQVKLGIVLLEEKRPQEALLCFQAAIKKDSNNAMALTGVKVATDLLK